MPETFGKLLNRAFKWHWNLLFLGAGAAFAFLSGEPGVVLPLLGAAELAYLGVLGTNRRFQNVLKGKEALKNSGPPPLPNAQLHKLLGFLDRGESQRFEALRERCANMLALRSRLQAGADGLGDSSAFRTESLDRMLWLFLKLLHQKAGLERFLSATRREDLERDLQSAEAQLARVKEQTEQSPGAAERQAAALEEKIGTIRDRLENHRRAAENRTLLDIELDKTEQKIHHVCEVGMTGGDSLALTAQIESISQTLKNSESDYVPASVRLLLDEETAPSIMGKALE